jgi:hypothetical protein
VGFVRSVFLEIKDLTCNAQFNFCFIDRSEFVRSALSGLRLMTRSRVTNSRI